MVSEVLCMGSAAKATVVSVKAKSSPKGSAGQGPGSQSAPFLGAAGQRPWHLTVGCGSPLALCHPGPSCVTSVCQPSGQSLLTGCPAVSST